MAGGEMRRIILILTVVGSLFVIGAVRQSMTTQPPRNVVFILSDDHRYDFMSF